MDEQGGMQERRYRGTGRKKAKHCLSEHQWLDRGSAGRSGEWDYPSEVDVGFSMRFFHDS